jgi:predicted metalloendopeptidase
MQKNNTNLILTTDFLVEFPAAILQHPFFDSSRPKYMNYGAIGWIAGHELTHGFDDQGHQFDRNGNFHDWWDPFTKQTYSTKTQCIIKQYGKFTPGESGIKVSSTSIKVSVKQTLTHTFYYNFLA